MGQVMERADAQHNLSARSMATAVALDPHFTMPVRPRLLEHLVVVELADGLIVEGAGARQVLRGREATRLLPNLLPLLDGTRGLGDLAAALGRSPSHIYAALALLYGCGLLDDAHEEPSPARPDGVPEDVAAFLGRHLDTTRVNRNVGAALARLWDARVAVVADAAASWLPGALRRTGVGHVAVAPVDRWQPALDAARRDGIDLVVVAADGAIPLGTLDEWCHGAGAPWLRSAYTTAGIEIGPRFEAGHTACYRCFTSEWRVTPVEPTGRHGAVWAGLLVDEVVALLARVGSARSTTGVTTVDLIEWCDRTAVIPRRPGCARCCPGSAPTEDPPLAFRYEQMVALPPRHLLSPKDHQHHYRPANLALQTLTKQYPSAPHVDLVPVAQAPAPAGAFAERIEAGDEPERRVDAAILAGLLPRVGGLRTAVEGVAPTARKVQRWAPTGGNLGSVQMYVLAVEVAGLTPGWYHYELAGHRLATARRCADSTIPGFAGVVGAPSAAVRPTSVELVRRITDGRLTPTPAALIVLTGALSRVAQKYFDFGYRIVCLDAGVAVTQLQAVASGYRLTTQVVDRWDDGLVLDELGLDPMEEPVTAVIGLYGKADDEAGV